MKAWLAAIVALVIALALAWSLIQIATEPAQGEAVPSSIYDGRLNELDREAAETAYKQQATHLFETWMKDATGQPARFQAGIANARRAFIASMAEIEKRSR